jgi:nucleotide-binding universal stress UspA family protein
MGAESRDSGAQVAPGGAGRPTVVVGYSGAPEDDRALAVAADITRRLGGLILVVHAVDLRDFPVDPDAADWEDRGAAALAGERERADHVLGGAGIPWRYEVRRGEPAAVLASAAAEHDALMIVVGSRGAGVRAAFEHLISPSVSHAVVGHQRRPVLVVPPAGRARSDDGAG